MNILMLLKFLKGASQACVLFIFIHHEEAGSAPTQESSALCIQHEVRGAIYLHNGLSSVCYPLSFILDDLHNNI